MLSKVLGRSDSRLAQLVVFPQATGYERALANRGSPDGSHAQSASGEDAEIAGLRERLRQLESRIAAERQDSFEAGRREGDEQARAAQQPILERLNASIADVLAMRSDLRRRAEKDVVQLALLIAKRVLHRQLSVDEGALTAIARIAFERLTRSEAYRVTVHPRFAGAINSALPGSQASRVQIVPDPDCALGTLVIHSAEGTIDASVDAQIEEISRGLTDRLING
jgi:flagellar assembly protein FliH